jgi:hypothetical protein
MLLVFVLGGFLRSLQFTSLNAIAFADVGQARMSHATSLSSVAQQLAAGFGVTFAAIIADYCGIQAHGTCKAAILHGLFWRWAC